ncbi:MAG: hypothetical protein ACI35S_01515 [Anaeroplasma sp.]
MYKSISKISLFSFIVLYNYTILRLFIFSDFYNNYGLSGLIPVLMALASITIVYIFLPKKIYNYDFYQSFINSKFKYIFRPILFLRAFLGLFYSSYLLMSMFFPSKFLLIYIGFLIVSLLISRDKPSDIIEIATLFGILGLFLYFLVFLSFINIDFSLISFQYGIKIDSIFLIIAFILDNLIYFLADKEKLKLNKMVVILAVFFSFLLFGFEFVLLVLTCGDVLFANDPFVGFILLTIQTVSRYLGNFKYIYAYLIIITGVFKFSFYLALLNDIKPSIKSSLLYFIILVILGIGLIEYIKKDSGQIQFISISLIIATILLAIWMFKEAYNVRLYKK